MKEVKTVKEAMDEVNVKSYKDCAWYVEENNGCRTKAMKCSCKEELDDFCIWMTKLLKCDIPDNDDPDSEDFTYVICPGCDKYSERIFEHIFGKTVDGEDSKNEEEGMLSKFAKGIYM